jgi:hypothetical protein
MNVETAILVDTVKQNADDMKHWACGICYRNMPSGELLVSLCGETRKCQRGVTVRCPMCWDILKTGIASCGHKLHVPRD